jgi:hypothetical protein
MRIARKEGSSSDSTDRRQHRGLTADLNLRPDLICPRLHSRQASSRGDGGNRPVVDSRGFGGGPRPPD